MVGVGANDHSVKVEDSRDCFRLAPTSVTTIEHSIDGPTNARGSLRKEQSCQTVSVLAS